MKCDQCGGKTTVIDTRHNAFFDYTRRRYKCQKCGKRQTSYEFRDIFIRDNAPNLLHYRKKEF